MKYNTRFNPTVSGSLHLGHLYVALVNATEAQRSGGKFYLRIDDTQEYWIWKLGTNITRQLIEGYQQDLKPFIPNFAFELQSMMPSIEDIADLKDVPTWALRRLLIYEQTPQWVADQTMVLYPYAPILTLEKVLWDFYDGINWLIRGEDLSTEFSLYCYFTEMIGVPRIRHTYIPRLVTSQRQELIDKRKLIDDRRATMSKTFGSYKIADQINRFGRDGVIELLKKSCLIDINGEFIVENIKWNPTVVGFEP